MSPINKRRLHIDPDNPPLTDEELKRMRPASEVIPDIVEQYRRARGTALPGGPNSPDDRTTTPGKDQTLVDPPDD